MESNQKKNDPGESGGSDDTEKKASSVNSPSRVLAHIAGPSGSGKTTIADLLKERRPDLRVRDLDEIDEEAEKILGIETQKNTSDAMLEQLYLKRQELLDAYLKEPGDAVLVGHHTENFTAEKKYLLDVDAETSARRAYERSLTEAPKYRRSESDLTLDEQEAQEVINSLTVRGYSRASAEAILEAFESEKSATWAAQAGDDIVGDRSYPLSSLLSEVGELGEAVVKLDGSGIREEAGDVGYTGQVMLAQRLGLNTPLLPWSEESYQKYHNRLVVWDKLFQAHGGQFDRKYLSGGSNYKKPEKIYKALEAAGLEPEDDTITRVLQEEETEPGFRKVAATVVELTKAKELSDSERYDEKAVLLRNLMMEHPGDFVIDSSGKGHPGITHTPTGFQFHLPKKFIPPTVTVPGVKRAAPIEGPRIDSFRQAVHATLWEDDPALSWVAVEDTPHGVLVKNASILHPDNRTSLEALLSRHWDVDGEVVYREGVLGVRDTLDEGIARMEKGASLRLGELLSLIDLLNKEHGAGIWTNKTLPELVEAVRAFIHEQGYQPERMRALHSSMQKRASAVNPGEHQAGLIPGVEIPEPPKARAVIIGGNPSRGRDRVEAYHQTLKDFLEELGYETQLVSSEDYADVPHADVAIGYSRGGGRLQFSDAPVKIAVGSEVEGIPSVRHPDDVTFRYRQDEISTIPDGVWDAHFTLTDEMKERMRELISPGVKEAAVGDFSHGCLMLPVPYDLSRQLVAWSQKYILEKNLDEQGIDFQPHVTVCYGFQPGFDAEALRPLMKEYAYVSAKLGKVSRFETEKYDVLKLDIVSADLRAWNRTIRERFHITTSYPDYKPHLTLAYVRPGTCKHLDGNSDWTNAILTTDRLEWSPAEGAKKNLYLRTKRIVTQ